MIDYETPSHHYPFYQFESACQSPRARCHMRRSRNPWLLEYQTTVFYRFSFSYYPSWVQHRITTRLKTAMAMTDGPAGSYLSGLRTAAITRAKSVVELRNEHHPPRGTPHRRTQKPRRTEHEQQQHKRTAKGGEHGGRTPDPQTPEPARKARETNRGETRTRSFTHLHYTFVPLQSGIHLDARV